jgi:hypothetical protein
MADDNAPDDDDAIDDFYRHAILKKALPGMFSSFDDEGPPILMPTFGEGLFKKFETVQFKAFGAEHPLDLTHTSQKWYSFLVEDCGQEAPAPALVASLTAKHIELFQAALTTYETAWDGLSGEFTASTHLWASWSSQGSGLAVKGAVFGLWEKAFEQTVTDYYDVISWGN